MKPGLPVADLTSGLWVAIAILAALAGRERTGKGSHVDFSMLDGQVSLLTLAAARYFALGEVPPRLGTEHPGRVPSATFRCKDGKYAHITASDQHWAPLCKALGLRSLGRDLSDQRGAGGEARRGDGARSPTAIVEARSRRAARKARRGRRAGRAGERRRRDPRRPARARARLVGSFDYPGVGEFKALALPYKFLGWDNPRDRPAADARRAHRRACCASCSASRRSRSRRCARPRRYDERALLVEDGVATHHAQSARGAQRAQPRDVRRAAGDAREGVSAGRCELVFVRGNGPVFCAGADLKERKGMSEEQVRARRMKALRRLRGARGAADAVRRGGARRGDRLGRARSPPPATSSSPRPTRRSARPRRSAARSARRSACRASSASAWPRT